MFTHQPGIIEHIPRFKTIRHLSFEACIELTPDGISKVLRKTEFGPLVSLNLSVCTLGMKYALKSN